MHPFSTPWKDQVFWCFQGLEKECIGNEWVNGRFSDKRYCFIENLLSNTSYRNNYLKSDAKKIVVNQDAIENVSIAWYSFVFCITLNNFLAAVYFKKKKKKKKKKIQIQKKVVCKW